MMPKRKVKTAIIILAVLTALCLTALAAVFIYNGTLGVSAKASLKDNYITSQSSGVKAVLREKKSIGKKASGAKNKERADIELYYFNSQDNVPFKAENMFPGDSVSNKYAVSVSYGGAVTVHFKADVKDGYEKLAEALKMKAVLLSTGETLYDGLMKDMPDVLCALSSEKSTTQVLQYQITVYIDTSLGNEFQNKELATDFKWWVEEKENLGPFPKTGDVLSLLPWIIVVVLSIAAVIIIIALLKRRRRDNG